MNSERQILKRLLEGVNDTSCYDEELEEASFEAGGHVYKCAFGKYSCDGEAISREDYFKAKEGGSAPTNRTKAEPKKSDKLSTSNNLGSTGIDFDDFINNSDVTYLEDPIMGFDDNDKKDFFGSVEAYNDLMGALGDDNYSIYTTLGDAESYEKIHKIVGDKKPTKIIKSGNDDYEDYEVYEFEDCTIVKDKNSYEPSYHFSEISSPSIKVKRGN